MRYYSREPTGKIQVTQCYFYCNFVILQYLAKLLPNDGTKTARTLKLTFSSMCTNKMFYTVFSTKLCQFIKLINL